MQTTPYGYKKPDLKDQDWWDQLYFNIVRTSAHKHDGVDSALLTSQSFTKTSQNLSFSGWVEHEDGIVKQTVNFPAGMDFTNFAPLFFVDGGAEDGNPVYLDYKKLTATTYELYTNNPTLSLRVLYV